MSSTHSKPVQLPFFCGTAKGNSGGCAEHFWCNCNEWRWMLSSFRNDTERNKIIIKVTCALYPKCSEVIKSLCVRNRLKFKLFFTNVPLLRQNWVSEFISSLIHKSFRQVLWTGSTEWLKRCDSQEWLVHKLDLFHQL